MAKSLNHPKSSDSKQVLTDHGSAPSNPTPKPIPSNTGRKKAPKARTSTSRTALRKGLGISSEKHWLEWLQSDLVKPYWCELWNDYLSKKRFTHRGPGFSAVQLRAIICEAPKYSPSSSTIKDKSDWDDVDHYACFLHNVREENLKREQGVFFNKGFEDDHMDDLVWALKGYLRKLHCRCKIDKPSGGRAIFGSALTGKIYLLV